MAAKIPPLDPAMQRDIDEVRAHIFNDGYDTGYRAAMREKETDGNLPGQ